MYIPMGYKITDNEMVKMSYPEMVSACLIEQDKVDEYIKQDEIIELEEYLKNTDWYSARLIETNKAIPIEIITERDRCRNRISFLREEE